MCNHISLASVKISLAEIKKEPISLIRRIKEIIKALIAKIKHLITKG